MLVKWGYTRDLISEPLCIIGALQTYNITDGGIWRDSYRTSAAHVLSFRRLYMSSWRIWSPDVDKD